MTNKQYFSFQYRLQSIRDNPHQFSSGQKYLTEKQLTQIENIRDALKYGRAFARGGWSVHNMVQTNRLSKAMSELSANRPA